MAASYTLLQFSADPWNARFEDADKRSAFTVYVPLLRLSRRSYSQSRAHFRTMVHTSPADAPCTY